MNGSGYVAGTRTAADGSWTVASLEPGSYKVRFVDPSGAHATEWYLDAATGFLAQPVVVASGVVDVDGSMASVP